MHNGYIDHKNKPVVNSCLWREFVRVKEGLTIASTHVKGHSTSKGNQRAHELATLTLKRASVKAGYVRPYAPPMSDEDEDEIRTLMTRCESDTNSPYVVVENEMFYKDPTGKSGVKLRRYVPTGQRAHLLNLAHNDQLFGGHTGIKKTCAKLKGYYWPG